MILYLFDKHLKLIETYSNPISAVMKRKLIGVDQLTAVGTADMAATLLESSYIGHYYQDRFYIYTIKKITTTNNRAVLEAVNYAYDELAHCTIIEDRRPQNVTAYAAMVSALDGTGWTFGTVEMTPTGSTSFYFITPLEAIKKIIEEWGIEPDFYFQFDGKKITGRKIDLWYKRGSLTGERYAYGSNLLQVVHEENRDEIVTALYGRGKGVEILDEGGNPTGAYGRRLDFSSIGWSKPSDPANKPMLKEYVEIPEMTAIYGYPQEDGSLKPRFGVLILEDETDPALLLDTTFKTLLEKSRPLVTFEAVVAKAGPYELGDTNYILRSDLGLEYEARIFEDEIDLLNPLKTIFRFGDYVLSKEAKHRKDLAKLFEGVSDQIKRTEQDVKGQLIKVSTDWYTALNDSLSDSFLSEASYNYDLGAVNPYGLPAGLYSFNGPLDEDPLTPEPTGFSVMRGGMIGRGNILANGTWDFNMISNAEGLNANNINAGLIKAQFVEIGGSSTFLEGYNPFLKADADQVYTKAQIDTSFQVLDGQVSIKISSEVTTQIEAVGIYRVDLISTGGLIFKNDEISTQIIARIYKNNEDVTDLIHPNRFKWTKINHDGTLDAAWNTSNADGKKQITITGNDVERRASFTCELLEG